MLISQFIHNFNTYQGIGEGYEVLREQFMNGWCYYFAKILESAFPGGEICLCYPYSHIVYLYNGMAYDFEGESDTEAEFLIPLSKFPLIENDFKRNNEGKSAYNTKAKVKKLGEDAYPFSYIYDEKSRRWMHTK